MDDSPTLLVVAHGTQSVAGATTVTELVHAVRLARPGLRSQLCFLDVLEPNLVAALSALPGPVVAVPALLSTGYHVRTDIPAAVAGRPDVIVTAHLGPDPRLTTALADRLRAAGARVGARVGLVAAGSSDPAARIEVAAAAADLSRALGAPVQSMAVTDHGLDLTGLEVASYVLAEGVFADTIAARARQAGATVISAPIGAHFAVAQLILDRYDAGRAELARRGRGGQSGMLGR